MTSVIEVTNVSKKSVYWQDGTFATPIHFQMTEKYVNDRVNETEQWQLPNSYGLYEIKFDENAMLTGSLKILRCKARFKDGTTINIPEDCSINSIDSDTLREKFGQKNRLKMFIELKDVEYGSLNIVHEGSDGQARWNFVETSVVDEESGQLVEGVQIRKLRAHLTVEEGGKNLGVEVLPIGQLRKSDKVVNQILVDNFYIPPILNISVCNEQFALFKQVEEIHHIIQSAIEKQAPELEGSNFTFESREVDRGTKILRLNQLNTAWAALEPLLKDKSAQHPQKIYAELCRNLGLLSILGPSRKPDFDKVRGYDHDDIGPIFKKVLKEIEMLLGNVDQVHYEQFEFKFGKTVKDGVTIATIPYRVEFNPKWNSTNYRLFLGVYSQQSDEDVAKIIKGTYYKLGPKNEVRQMSVDRQDGLLIKPCAPHAKLVGIKNTTWFSIDREPEEIWKKVLTEKVLGFWYADADKISKNGFPHPETKETIKLNFILYVLKNIEES